jgi:hypothetical protein
MKFSLDFVASCHMDKAYDDTSMVFVSAPNLPFSVSEKSKLLESRSSSKKNTPKPL